MTGAKLSHWKSKRQGSLNRFYTRDAVGDLLCSEIGKIEIGSVLDLGAGEGSLSAAIARRWPKAHYQTVDIDESCIEGLHETLNALGVNRHDHLVADVLDGALPATLDGAQFDLAVCNPPFFRPQWKREFADILQQADFSEACPTVTEVTAEIIFLAQNIRIVRDGGTIALIVPDGLATGWRARAFRRALMAKHTLRSVTQLPPYSFHSTEAYCFILVITKGKPSFDTPIKLLKLDEQSQVSDPVWVSQADAEMRMDWTYHSTLQEGSSNTTTLRKLGAEIRRGSLSTVDRRNVSYDVFHTGDFPSVKATIRLKSGWVDYGEKRVVLAEAGDILIARVDRDLHNKITFVEAGQVAITDCILRVRLSEPLQKPVFAALSSDKGRARIQAVTKGVGARLLGKGDLLDIALDLTTANAL